MERCTEHGLINCRCRETLASWLGRQFAESVSDRVARSDTWRGGARLGDDDRGHPGSDRGRQRGEHGGEE